MCLCVCVLGQEEGGGGEGGVVRKRLRVINVLMSCGVQLHCIMAFHRAWHFYEEVLDGIKCLNSVTPIKKLSLDFGSES